MGIRNFQKMWDNLARTDPFWAVLTKPEKQGNRWDRDDFFRTGENEVRYILRKIESLGLEVHKGRALDFGCGVGRLTSALAVHFDEACGVDISPAMLELAEKYNQKDNCRYVLNETDDLRLFSDGSFDFILSMITLQHIEGRYVKKYLDEFLRVLSPNGLIVFQMVSRPKINRVIGRTQQLIMKSVRNFKVPFSLSKKEIVSVIEKNGGKVIEVFEDGKAGPEWESFQYYVKRGEPE